MLLALAGAVLPASSTAAAPSASQFQAVSYRLVSRTPVAGQPANKPLFDYVYKVDVRNGGSVPGAVTGRATNKGNSFSMADADADFGPVLAGQTKTSSDTITVRAKANFDRSLDARSVKNGVWQFNEAGKDDDDASIAALPKAVVDWNDGAVASYYNTKLHALLQWTFLVRFDTSAPTIDKLLPQGALNTATPELSASYSDHDGAGVDLATISMMLDGVDISGQLIKNASGLTYLPQQALGQGTHKAVLSVADMAANVGSASWSFSVDTVVPAISAALPDSNLAASRMSVVSAQFADAGGIDTSRIVLSVDGADVSELAVKSTTGVSYTPAGGFADGKHTVSLAVRDMAGNAAAAEWAFIVDGAAPTLSNLLPAEGAALAADALPAIGAQFKDGIAGINLQSALLEVDGHNVTAQAQVTATGITYTPLQALAEGNHTVKLTVADTVGNTSAQSWAFKTATAPLIANQAPNDIFVPSGSTPTVSASFSDVGAGIDAAKTVFQFDGVDVTAGAQLDASGISYRVPAALSDARHHARLVVVDKAGNQTELSWSFIAASAPVIGTLTPDNVLLPAGSSPVIAAAYSDANSGIDLANVRLFVNAVNVTSMAQITATGISYTPAAPLAEGTHTIFLEVANKTNGAARVAWGFDVDSPATHAVQISNLDSNAIAQHSAIAVKASAQANKTRVMSLSVNGKPMGAASVSGATEYTGMVDLVDGNNVVTVIAAFEDGETRSASANVAYFAPPVITILTPQDKSAFGPVNPNSPRDLTGKVERPITLTGKASKPVVSVVVNQQAATLQNGGTEFRFENLFLHEGTNVLSAVATDANGKTSTSTVTVTVDQTAPYLSVESPILDAVTSNARVDVRGVVNDAIEGWIDVPYSTVTISNASNGIKVSAKVTDRFYIAEDVPLEIGTNALRVSATDHLGNSRYQDVRVTRIAAGSNRITLLSGNRQIGPLNTRLPKPLAVVALAKDGNPLANLPISFDILRGTGTLGGTDQAAAGTRNVVAVTDEAGRAQVFLTAGRQSGEAGNMVRASSAGIAEDVVFTATGLKGIAAHIRADAGTTQYVETDSAALEVMSAIVTDTERNRLPNASVVFTIDQGEAAFLDAAGNKLASITVRTDKNGMAAARPIGGAHPGLVRASARVIDTPGAGSIIPATYQLNVLAQGVGPTQFSGKVLTNTGEPLAGVRVSIGRTALSSTTGVAGDFTFEGQVPPGKIDLFIDGRTANVQSGQYPAMHFEALAVRGQNNILPHPIYLPALLMSEAKVVGGDQDVVMKIPGFDGFEMLVKANSVTFPDGSRTGLLVVSPVHQDKLPMVPPGGASAFMAPAWTIQPSGTRFDPPLQVKMPNSMNLKPGETQEFYQWDHDLATFVPMGRATVSEDGAQLVSDANSGLTKAGWGGSAPPGPPPKCAQTCARCFSLNEAAPCPTCVWAKDDNIVVKSQNSFTVTMNKSKLDGFIAGPISRLFGTQVEGKVKLLGARVVKTACCFVKQAQVDSMTLPSIGVEMEMEIKQEVPISLAGPVGRVLAVLGLEAVIKGKLVGVLAGSATYDKCKDGWKAVGSGTASANFEAGIQIGREFAKDFRVRGALLGGITANGGGGFDAMQEVFEVKFNLNVGVFAKAEVEVFNLKITPLYGSWSFPIYGASNEASELGNL